MFHNHTIETLYSHHYTKKTTHSSVLFTSMMISIANLAKKHGSLVFPVQSTATCAR